MKKKKKVQVVTDAALFSDADDLMWDGPTTEFHSWTERMQAPALLDRCLKAEKVLVRSGNR